MFPAPAAGARLRTMLETDVVPGVHRVQDAYTNWYLIEDGGRLTVVDCGVPTSWESFHEALGRTGRTPADVAAVVLTHAHFDHLGFAERARAELDVPVWVHDADVPLTRHPMGYQHERPRRRYVTNAKAMPIMASLIRNRAFWPPPVAEVRTFDGGTLDVPGSPRVIHSPGHTFGHCAFHLPDRDALIAGDAIVMLDPYTGGTGPQIVAGAATADSRMALASLDALAATEATTVLTGHGPPWRDGIGEAVRRARAVGPH
jgi:glyoxylase-like metal-dependent hydrolase (beta-lactamase superfamily II)